MKGILIKSNNEVSVIEYEDELTTLQELVGGWIEYVPIDNDIFMIIDEEGKLKGKEINATATRLIPFRDVIVGDALVVGTRFGENISLTDEEINKYLKEVEG